MPAKIITFHREARAELLKGVRRLAAPVKVTLGPQGRVVAIDRKFGAPLVTKDGVTVAKEIELAEPAQNAGAQLVRQVAVRTSEQAGDGTTTATILAEAIFAGAFKNVEAGADPVALERGIRAAVEAACGALEKMSSAVKGKADIERVATVAANNDASIGGIIADALDKVGKDGAVTVEDGRSIDTVVEVIEGMQFDRGFLSPHFINRPEKLQCALDDAYVLVCEPKIDNVQSFVPILELVARTGRPLLVIADDLGAEALAVLVVNRLRGVFQSCAVKAPGFGDRRKELLGDIAALTGARPVFTDLGVNLDALTIQDLGRAKQVIVEKETTTIIQGAGKKSAVDARVAEVKAAMDAATSDYDKEKLQERLAKLSGGVAVIRVGGATETEMKERRARIDDALHAARAAVEEGVLPGGGVALARAAEAVAKLKLKDDEKAGAEIVRRALDKPLRQLAENAGAEGSVAVQKVLAGKSDSFGYNALTGEYEDLVKAGILDARKVARLALQNAASIATVLLTTDAVVMEKPGEDEARPPGFEGGMPPM